jgi:hypothetical protein
MSSETKVYVANLTMEVAYNIEYLNALDRRAGLNADFQKRRQNPRSQN